jgi:hypothetical protein
VSARFGNRKPPAASYAFGPILRFDEAEGLWVGGTFWDGARPAGGWATRWPSRRRDRS